MKSFDAEDLRITPEDFGKIQWRALPTMDVYDAAVRLYRADPVAYVALIGHLQETPKHPQYADSHSRALGALEGVIAVAGCVIPKQEVVG